MVQWRQAIRELHEKSWGFDWATHLTKLNARLGLAGPDAFRLPPGLPPAWVVGDLDTLAAGEWVLVVSLNQARREGDEGWHVAQQYTSQSYWDHWRFLNRDWWEPRFYRPLVRLAATALGLSVDPDDEAAFATTRMIFVELCPYPSRQFALAGPAIEQLAVHNIGFRTATSVRRLLMEEAAPGAVLVNGIAAVSEFERFHRGQVELIEQRYPSVNGARSLRHWEGVYPSTHGAVPVVGFPFLRKPSTHNSYADIEELGRRVRELRARAQQGEPSRR